MSAPDRAPRDGRHDFDFLVGEWSVHNRRLERRLVGCTTWEEFPSRCRARTALGGLANVDEFTMERPSETVHAMTVRLYDPASGDWSLYWAASATPGRFDVPIVGRFDGPVGEFYAQDRFEGRHVLVRFIWTVLGADACRWEQAFSPDGGRSWETNWVMEFTRRA